MTEPMIEESSRTDVISNGKRYSVKSKFPISLVLPIFKSPSTKGRFAAPDRKNKTNSTIKTPDTTILKINIMKW